jgi:hypothetical protein
LDLASTNNELDALQLARIDVEKWLAEWDISAEEKSTFLKTIADAYEKSGQLYIRLSPLMFMVNSTHTTDQNHMNIRSRTCDHFRRAHPQHRPLLSRPLQQLSGSLSSLISIPCSNSMRSLLQKSTSSSPFSTSS